MNLIWILSQRVKSHAFIRQLEISTLTILMTLKISVLTFLGLMMVLYSILLFFFKDFIYLFSERVEGREKERERNISWLLSHALNQGPGWQPRLVP